jgi:hypothetical protein
MSFNKGITLQEYKEKYHWNTYKDFSMPIEPSFGETISANLRIHNPIVSNVLHLAAGGFDNFKIDENYNPFEDERILPEHYSTVAHSNSAEQTTILLERYEEIKKDRQIIERSGFGANAIGIISAVATDPTIYAIPFIPGFALNRGAIQGARSGFAQASISEGLLHQSQPDKSIKESVPTVMMATGLTTLIGSFYKPIAKKVSYTDDPIDGLDGAKKAFDDVGEQMENGVRKEDLVTSWGKVTDDASPEIKVNSFVDTIHKIFPGVRTLQSVFPSARNAVESLVETTGIRVKNYNGIKTDHAVETLYTQDMGNLASFLSGITKSYKAYRVAMTGKDELLFTSAIRDAGSRFFGQNVSHMTLPEFRRTITKHLQNNTKSGIPQIDEQVVNARKILDDYGERAVAAGILKREQLMSNHVPRMWNVFAIFERQDELVDKIYQHQLRHWQTENWAKPNRASVKEAVQSIVDGGQAIENMAVAGPRGIFSARKINLLNEEEFSDFLITDIDDILRRYTRVASMDIRLAQKFGHVDMRNVFENIKNEAKALIAKTKSEKKRIQITKQMEKNIKDLEDMRDILRGVYGLAENPYSIGSRAGRLALDFNNLIALGGATVASVSDIGRFISVNGFKGLFQNIKLALKDWDYYKMAAQEAKLAGTALDMVLQSRAMAMFGLEPLAPRFTKLEAGVGHLTNGFFIANLLSPWNALIKQATGIQVSNNIIRDSIAWSAGKLSKKRQERMLASGLDQNDAKQIANLYAAHGEKVRGVFLPNTQNWKAPVKDIEPAEGVSFNIGKGAGKTQNGRYVPAFYNQKTKTIHLDEDYIKTTMFEEKAWTKPKVKGVKAIPEDAIQTPDELYNFVKNHEILHTKFPNPKKRLKGDPVDVEYENFINKLALEEIEATKSLDKSVKKIQERFRATLKKTVDEYIVTPGAGDQPKWVHSSWGRFVAQYKSFAFGASNRVMAPSLQYKDMNTLMGIGMMIYIGGVVQDMRRGESKDTLEFIKRGIDHASIVPLISMSNTALEAIMEGNYSYLGGQIAPVITTAERAAKQEWDKLIPAGNHFAWPVVNHLTMADIFDKAKP